MRAQANMPLFGYNSSVRVDGRLYHVQTEDSGHGHPHVITHVFAEGGRVVVTLRSSYAEHVGAPDCSAVVRRLLVNQHRDAFVGLHEGRFDLGVRLVEPAEVVSIVQGPTDERAPAEVVPIVAEAALARSADDGAGDLIGIDPSGDTLGDIIVRDVALQLGAARRG